MMRRLLFVFILAVMAVSSMSQMLMQPSAESDSLFAAGVELYNVGKYREAIPLFAKSDSLDKAQLDSTSNRRSYSSMWLASCYYKLGDTFTAMRHDSLYSLYPIDRRLTRITDSIYNEGYALYVNGNYKEAIEKFSLVIYLSKKQLGDSTYYIFSPLAVKGISEYYSGNLYQAIDDWIEAYGICQEYRVPMNINNCKIVYDNIFAALSKLEDEKHVSKYVSKVIDYTKSDSLKCVSCYYLACVYSSYMNNYKMAVDLGEKAKSSYEFFCIRNGRELNDTIYGNILSNLAWDYSFMGNEKAIDLQRKAMDIWKSYYGEYSHKYAYGCRILGTINYELGNLDSALYFSNKAIDIYNNIGGYNYSSEYIYALNEIANVRRIKGNLLEAKKVIEKSLNIADSIIDKESETYAKILNNLALIEWTIGDYVKAVELGSRVLTIYRKIFGDSSKSILTSLDNLALYYSSMGNVDKAISLSKWSIKNQMNSSDVDSVFLSKTLRNYAGYLFLDKRFGDAVDISIKALDIMKKRLGESHHDYLVTYANLSRYLYCLARYDDAIDVAKKAYDLIDSNIGRDNEYGDVTLGVLADSYWEKGKYDSSIRILEDLMELKLNRYGGFTLSSLKSVGNNLLAEYLSLHRQDAIPLEDEISDMLEKNILMSFSELTSYERSLFWEDYGRLFYSCLQPLSLYRFSCDSLIRSDAYNGALFSKGILLNSDIELSKLIAESGDSVSVAKYERLRNNRLNLMKLYEKPIAERHVNTDSLERLVETQEKELLKISKTFGDYTKNLSVKWTEVRDRLGNGEMAVEFLSFPVENDSVMYVALTLKKGYDSPEMVPLFEEKQLKRVSKDLYYTSPILYNLIWKPLEGEMERVTTVYFAPSGELYNLPIENLPIDGSTYNSDLRSYRRLSSTRQLALRRDGVEVEKAAVYGGLKYDTDTVTLANDSRKYRTAEPVQWSSRAVADSLNLRDGVYELPATKIEAEDIDKALESAKIDTELYTDTIGTEASFKALSGSGVNALHIATHGFYWTEREVSRLDNLAFLNDDMPAAVQEDKALTRSGLLLAGANTALKGLPLPEGVEDGVLTAKEIAGMDLRRLDLVALSACQTGLGEITGDGVFGLQRGFKKAGANTLLMSLWKVDDTATQLLMTQFYKNMLSGMGKYEALTAAQKYLRELEVEVKPEKTAFQQIMDGKDGKKEKNPGSRTVRKYANPYYWAAFVLLDGVD